MKKYLLFSILLLLLVIMMENPVMNMLERMQKGLYKRFKIGIQPSIENKDYFDLSEGEQKIKVRANNYVNVAFGINWYIKYHCLFCEDHLSELPISLLYVNEHHSQNLILFQQRKHG